MRIGIFQASSSLGLQATRRAALRFPTGHFRPAGVYQIRAMGEFTRNLFDDTFELRAML